MQEIGDVTIKVNSKTEKSTEEKYQDLLNKKKEQDRLAEEREKKQKQEIEKTKKNIKNVNLFNSDFKIKQRIDSGFEINS